MRKVLRRIAFGSGRGRLTITCVPTVSIVVPCRDEAACIDECLAALHRQDYAGVIEVLVAEGKSRDDTRARLNVWMARDGRIRVVDNPEGIVPTGLNRAIRLAVGEIIVRADAHSRYAEDYVTRCVETLLMTGAANVGGPALIAGDLPVQRAFALAAASPSRWVERDPSNLTTRGQSIPCSMDVGAGIR